VPPPGDAAIDRASLPRRLRRAQILEDLARQDRPWPRTATSLRRCWTGSSARRCTPPPRHLPARPVGRPAAVRPGRTGFARRTGGAPGAGREVRGGRPPARRATKPCLSGAFGDGRRVRGADAQPAPGAGRLIVLGGRLVGGALLGRGRDAAGVELAARRAARSRTSCWPSRWPSAWKPTGAPRRTCASPPEVQRRLLPVKTIADGDNRVRRALRAGRGSVGGDYYDFLDLGRGQLGLVLGDVSGKGLYAALLMANLQASVRSLSRGWHRRPHDAARQPRPLVRRGDGGQPLRHAVLRPLRRRPRRLRYANCGHQPPFLLRAGGGIETPRGDRRGHRAPRRVDLRRRGNRPRAGRSARAVQRRRHEAMSPRRGVREARLVDTLSLHRDRPLTR